MTQLLDEPPSTPTHQRAITRQPPIASIGAQVSSAWREDTLTRAEELESLCAWIVRTAAPDGADRDAALRDGVHRLLGAARQAASSPLRSRIRRSGSEIQRAMGNLYAAEAELLNMAPPRYLLGQLPSLLNHVQRHLPPTDARRREVERIAQLVGVKDSDHPLAASGLGAAADHEVIIELERGKLVTAARGASSAALREQLRVRSFRNVLVSAALIMSVLAVGLAIWGYQNPTVIPLCFQPEVPEQTVVVCPTAETRVSDPGDDVAVADIDGIVGDTSNPFDTLVIELIGLTAAAVAAAAAIRGIRGSSESLHLPVALALLKLPTGALTAYLGLLLMRGQFIPGLSALDTSAQIIAWAAVFGYAQQLFTRLVDQQAHSVLDDVRAADKPAGIPVPA